MTGVRGIEVALGGLEDNILSNLGYREYSVSVGGVTLDPPPEVIQKSIRSYTEGQMQRFIDAMGGNGNPVAFFEAYISRLIPESTIRTYDYWLISRDGFTAKSLLVDLIVDDSRYKATLGVIKVVGNLPA